MRCWGIACGGGCAEIAAQFEITLGNVAELSLQMHWEKNEAKFYWFFWVDLFQCLFVLKVRKEGFSRDSEMQLLFTFWRLYVRKFITYPTFRHAFSVFFRDTLFFIFGLLLFSHKRLRSHFNPSCPITSHLLMLWTVIVLCSIYEWNDVSTRTLRWEISTRMRLLWFWFTQWFTSFESRFQLRHDTPFLEWAFLSEWEIGSNPCVHSTNGGTWRSWTRISRWEISTRLRRSAA